jgi:hypothetical protein
MRQVDPNASCCGTNRPWHGGNSPADCLHSLLLAAGLAAPKWQPVKESGLTSSLLLLPLPVPSPPHEHLGVAVRSVYQKKWFDTRQSAIVHLPLDLTDVLEQRRTTGVKDGIPIADDMAKGTYVVVPNGAVLLRSPNVAGGEIQVARSTAVFVNFEARENCEVEEMPTLG